jgi:mRNA interferase MazF
MNPQIPTSAALTRTEVYVVDFGSTTGHEQAGVRPAIVVSSSSFNQLYLGLVFVVPLTTREREYPFHIKIEAPEGGLRNRSFAMCEQCKSISTQRFVRRIGLVTPETMASIDRVLRDFLSV